MAEIDLNGIEAIANAGLVSQPRDTRALVAEVRRLRAASEWPDGFDCTDDASVELAVELSYVRDRAEAAETRMKVLEQALRPFANLLPDNVEPADALQRKLQEWCRGARQALSPSSPTPGQDSNKEGGS